MLQHWTNRWIKKLKNNLECSYIKAMGCMYTFVFGKASYCLAEMQGPTTCSDGKINK